MAPMRALVREAKALPASRASGPRLMPSASFNRTCRNPNSIRIAMTTPVTRVYKVLSTPWVTYRLRTRITNMGEDSASRLIKKEATISSKDSLGADFRRLINSRIFPG